MDSTSLMYDADRQDEEECNGNECPICMMNIPHPMIFPTKKHRNKIKITILNCSHVFHDTCISNFEKFTRSDMLNSCPMCRNTKQYCRRILSECCIGYCHSKQESCHIYLNYLDYLHSQEIDNNH